jgi:hypothetical protein
MQNSGDHKPATTCAEFHEQLPFLMDSGRDIDNEPHLKSCDNCRTLVTDLRYIADQAKLLLPMHDPSPRVWNSIQSTLEKEGLAKEGRWRGPAQIVGLPAQTSNAHIIAWAAGIAAVIVLGFGLIQMNERVTGRSGETAAIDPATVPDFDAEDVQVLAQLEQRSPAMREIYAKGLRDVNASIAEAKRLAEQDPQAGGEYLRAAYSQKAMLYEMATARSLN